MAEFIGSSGTMVAATLETVGMYYQSYLLDVFGPALLSSLGALCYLVGAFCSLVVFISTGQPKYAVWLLVGPGLFYAVITSRTETTGADWMFGSWSRDRQKVEALVEPSIETEWNDPRVSSLFATYNRLVSSLFRQTVRRLVDTKDDIDSKFIVRQQLFSVIATPSTQGVGFRELLHAGFVTNCSRYIKLGKDIVDRSLPREHRCGKDNKAPLADSYDLEANKVHSLTDNARKYVATLLREDQTLIDNIEVTNVPQDCISRILRDECLRPEQLTITEDWVGPYEKCVYAEKGSASDYLRRLCERSREAAANPGSAPKTTSDIITLYGEDSTDQELEARISKFLNRGLRCHEIWNLIYAGLHREAMQSYSRGTQKIGELEITPIEDELKLCNLEKMPDGMMSELVAFTGGDSPMDIIRFIAKNLFREEMTSSATSEVAALYSNMGEIYKSVGPQRENTQTYNARVGTHRREWEHRMGLMVAAAKLPYIQGLLLYWLALVFPFFACFLLVPGKHVSFFLWFGLWAWAKSWDLGYAVVYLLDDVLHAMFVSDFVSKTGDAERLLSADAAVAIMNMREMDPSFQLTTYYSIISVALMSIPTIMGYVFISGINGGVGLITAGVKRAVSGRYGGAGGAPTQIAQGLHARHWMGEAQAKNDMATAYVIRDQAINFDRPAGLGIRDSGQIMSSGAEAYRRSGALAVDTWSNAGYGFKVLEGLGQGVLGLGPEELAARRGVKKGADRELENLDNKEKDLARSMREDPANQTRDNIRNKRNLNAAKKPALDVAERMKNVPRELWAEIHSKFISGYGDRLFQMELQVRKLRSSQVASDYMNSPTGLIHRQNEVRGYAITLPGAEELPYVDTITQEVNQLYMALDGIIDVVTGVTKGAGSVLEQGDQSELNRERAQKRHR